MNKKEDKICWVCGSIKNITTHHLREVKAKHKGKVRGEIRICRKCHDLIEEKKVGIRWGKKVEYIRNKTKRKTLAEIKKVIDKLKIKVKKQAKESDISFYKNKEELFDADTKCFLEYLDDLKEKLLEDA